MTDDMKDISHTNPYTGESFGEQVQVFDRGTTVAADGGEPGADGPTDTTRTDAQTMKDVDHTPPNESDGVNRVYERGTEGRDESV
jgi:hypothetical protein